MIALYSGTSCLLFLISIVGILKNRKSLILILLYVELMFLSLNFGLIIWSTYLDDVSGYLFSLSLLSLAAAESAIGLSLIVSYYRLKGNLSVLFLNLLRG